MSFKMLAIQIKTIPVIMVLSSLEIYIVADFNNLENYFLDFKVLIALAVNFIKYLFF